MDKRSALGTVSHLREKPTQATAERHSQRSTHTLSEPGSRWWQSHLTSRGVLGHKHQPSCSWVLESQKQGAVAYILNSLLTQGSVIPIFLCKCFEKQSLGLFWTNQQVWKAYERMDKLLVKLVLCTGKSEEQWWSMDNRLDELSPLGGSRTPTLMVPMTSAVTLITGAIKSKCHGLSLHCNWKLCLLSIVGTCQWQWTGQYV